MIEDAHLVCVASTSVRLIRFSSYLETSARSVILRKLTRGGPSRETCSDRTWGTYQLSRSVVIVCREASRGDTGSHPAYLARFIHAVLDKAQHSRQPSRAPSPVASQRPLHGVAPAFGTDPSIGLRVSQAQEGTPPDFVWNEMVSAPSASADTSCGLIAVYVALARVSFWTSNLCNPSGTTRASGMGSLRWPAPCIRLLCSPSGREWEWQTLVKLLDRVVNRTTIHLDTGSRYCATRRSGWERRRHLTPRRLRTIVPYSLYSPGHNSVDLPNNCLSLILRVRK
jgi:hypothetical protein